MRSINERTMRLFWGALAVTCIACQQSPTVPSKVGTTEALIQALQREGLATSLGGKISPGTIGFFTVPAQQASVNGEPLSIFEYSTADKAADEAALITSDAQPNPRAQITWISKPHFYHHHLLIVLYVGCSSEIVAALEEFLGPPIVTGQALCR
jgi:hypothetical protein